MTLEAVRPAEESDVERCAELLGEAVASVAELRGGRELADLGPVPGPPADGGIIASWIAAADRMVMVGLFEGIVVGVSAGRWREAGERRLGTVTACYVQPEARGVGVGSALVAATVGWLAQEGCTDIDALALPGDRAMKQLFEAAGFKARLLTLHRMIG